MAKRRDPRLREVERQAAFLSAQRLLDPLYRNPVFDELTAPDFLFGKCPSSELRHVLHCPGCRAAAEDAAKDAAATAQAERELRVEAKKRELTAAGRVGKLQESSTGQDDPPARRSPGRRRAATPEQVTEVLNRMPRATRAEQAKALDVHPKTLQTYLRRRRR